MGSEKCCQCNAWHCGCGRSLKRLTMQSPPTVATPPPSTTSCHANPSTDPRCSLLFHTLCSEVDCCCELPLPLPCALHTTKCPFCVVHSSRQQSCRKRVRIKVYSAHPLPIDCRLVYSEPGPNQLGGRPWTCMALSCHAIIQKHTPSAHHGGMGGKINQR